MKLSRKGLVIGISMNNADDDIKNKLAEQNNKATNYLVTGMTLLAITGVPVSVTRYSYTGWQLSYTIQCIALLVMIFLFIFRYKLQQNIKIYIVTIIASLISVLDLLIFGLYGNGILWGAFTLMLLFFFFKTREIIIGSGVILFVYLFSMYQFVISKKPFPGDSSFFLSQFPTWVTAFFGSAMFMVLIASIVRMQKNQTKEFLLILNEKNKEIRYLSDHDPLTGLLSQRVATKMLGQVIKLAERRGDKVALMFLDLDGFKLVNDTHGHDAGDEVLIQVSKRLKQVVRNSDIVCRIGGDEFLIILSNVKDKTEVKEVSKRLINKIREVIFINSFQVEIGVSIGVSLFPENATNPTDLRKKADELMYTVKKSGKNNFAISS